MISFRYHIVSIVSVFLALAVGVALGGGPLKGEVDNTLVEQVRADRQAKQEMQAQISELRSANDFVDTFARTVAPAVVGGKLDGRVVDLVVLPGASDDAVSGLSELVVEAGGTVGGTVRVGDKLLGLDSKQLVDELADQLLDTAPDVAVDSDAAAYERMGAVIARAVGTTEDRGTDVDSTATSILSGLSTAGLLSADGDLNRRGSLVLLVTGASAGSAEDREAGNTIVAALAGGIDAHTDGVVVAGPIAAARANGVIEAIRSDVALTREVSTVDAIERTAGREVAVLALREQADGGAGHYGAVNAPDGAMPGAVETDG